MDNNQLEDKKEGEYKGNCVIYTSSREMQDPEEVEIEGDDALVQGSECADYAKKHKYINVAYFFGNGWNGREDMTYNEDIDKLFGYCFNPSHRVDAVIIMERTNFIADRELYMETERRFGCLGIKLLVTKDENGIGVEDCLTEGQKASPAV